MDRLLLSRLTKDFLNEDASLLSRRERYRRGWGGSVLVSHPQAKTRKRRVKELLDLRERFEALFQNREAGVNLSTAPRLVKPKDPPPGSLQPAWYFSRGALDADKKKNAEPILYLLTETHETAKARPVPGNTYLFKSLCKGKGVLRRNQLGLVYLDIDNRFISMMLPYLKAQGLVRPPYFNLFGSPEGAHIPVISAREAGFHYLDEVVEVGQEFSFEIEGLYSMQPFSWPEVEQVWFFKIKSEELENLRQRYFLPSLPGGHAFPIAVAVKPKVGFSESPRPLPLMRINIAFTAA